MLIAVPPKCPQPLFSLPVCPRPAMAASRASAPRLIETEADLEDGIRRLRRTCPVIRRIHDATGLPPLRRRSGGFEGLARIVVGQQLSVASAAAIWARTEAVVQPFDPVRLLAVPDPMLRAQGLSVGKVRTLRAVATAMTENGLDLAALDGQSVESVHAALTAISGIGPWTADVYVLFCIGHADGFAPGDLALQDALQMATGLETRPNTKQLEAAAESWRPWRGVAARLLWAYYKVEKNTKSGVPV